MVNIRRQKLKAIRSGCIVKAVNKCNTHVEVLNLMKLNDEKRADGIRGDVETIEEESEDGLSE